MSLVLSDQFNLKPETIQKDRTVAVCVSALNYQTGPVLLRFSLPEDSCPGQSRLQQVNLTCLLRFQLRRWEQNSSELPSYQKHVVDRLHKGAEPPQYVP